MKVVSLTLLCSLMFLIACSGKKAKSKVTFTRAFIAGSAQLQGGMTIWGINSNGESFSHSFSDESTPMSLQLDHDTWTFYAIGHIGPNSMEGANKCDSVNVSLESTEVFVDLNLSDSNCASGDFSEGNYLSDDQFNTISIISCSDLSSVTQAGNCDTPLGDSASYEIFIPQYVAQDTPSDQYTLSSGCFDIDNPSLSTTATNKKLPTSLIGNDNFSFPIGIHSFDGPGCSGKRTSFLFKDGLIANTQKSITHSDAGITKIFLETQPSLNADSITGGVLSFNYIGTDSFDATFTFTGDNNSNSTATIYYCDNTGLPGCDPVISGSSFSMSKNVSQFEVNTSVLSAPFDAGDEIKIQIVLSDPDGVTNNNVSDFITLQNITTPTIVSITPPVDDTYSLGQMLSFNINFSESVIVTGVPQINLDIGGVPTYIDYTSGSGSTTLTFQYTVDSNLEDSDGIIINSPLELNGGTIESSSAVTADLNLTPLATNLIYIDSKAPVDTSADIQFAQTYSNTGNTITISWSAFSDPNLNNHHIYTYSDASCSILALDHGLTGSSLNNTSIINGLTDGQYYAQIDAIDSYGNTTTSTCSTGFITVDTTPPIDPPANPLFTNSYNNTGTSIEITWSAFSEPDLDVLEVYTYTDSICSSGESLQASVSTVSTTHNISILPEGEYYAKLKVTDLAGNMTESTCSSNSIIVDTTPPTMPTLNYPDSTIWSSDLNLLISGSSDTNNITYHYTTDSTPVNCSSLAGPNVLLLNSSYVDGDIVEVKVITCDDAGNMSSVLTYNYFHIKPVVEPYFSNASDWMDMVENKNDQYSPACTIGGSTECFHGARFRKIIVKNAITCSDFNATDTLNVFDWQCDDSITPDIQMVGRLKKDLSLKDLINNSGWIFNDVTITSSALPTGSYVTPSDNFWVNPIIPLPQNAAVVTTLSSTGSIYYYETGFTSMGFDITADKIAIVNIGGPVQMLLQPNTTPAGNCDIAAGGLGSIDFCMFAGTNRNFLYFDSVIIRGDDSVLIDLMNIGLNFDGLYNSIINEIKVLRAQTSGISLFNSTKNLINHYESRAIYDTLTLDISTIGKGVFLSNSNENILRDLNVSSSGHAGVSLINSDANNISTLHSFNSGIYGLEIDSGSDKNIIYDARLSNIVNANATQGSALMIGLNGPSNDNILTSVLASASSGVGAEIYREGNIIQNLTVSNNYDDGLITDTDTTNGSFLRIASINNALSGVHSAGAQDNDFFDIASANNGDNGIQLDIPSGPINRFHGLLKTNANGINGECWTDSGTALLDQTCANQGASSASYTNQTLQTSFFGKGSTVAYNESVSNSWLSSLIAGPSITVGYDGTTFPDVNQRTSCQTGTCAFWDWSLLFTDNALRSVLSTPINSDVHTHTFSDLSSSTFLRNARELLPSDGTIPETGFEGDDDGLCESNEACVINKNIGQYQGHGSINRNMGADIGGLNIIMYEYTNNGY